MLSRNFFQEVTSHIDGGFRYVGYVSHHHPLVLFSKKSGEPLAALHFYSPSASTVVAERPDSNSGLQKFQGLINKDSQHFELVLTNLSSKGMINFNILRSGTFQVDSTDPGPLYGVNEINELRPYETYSVVCDQVNNRRFKLTAIQAGALSVRQDEQQAELTGNKTQGSYFYLSVVPELGEMTSDFSETVWRAANYFVIKAPYQHPLPCGYSGRPRRVMESEPQLMERGSAMRHSRVLSAPRMMIGGGEVDGRSNMMYRSRAPRPQPFQKQVEEVEVIDDDVIMDSSAAAIEYGEQVEVSSAETGKTYDYELNSPPCMIGLSVQPALQFVSSPSTLYVEELEQLINTMKNQNFQEFLSRRVFESETCCVCLEASSQVVFYICGHKATCSVCSNSLDKCPMCRERISAKLVV
ncbi:hypothetical protein RCL1_003709 [Eukaryota sp. TZLM3-RCL]